MVFPLSVVSEVSIGEGVSTSEVSSMTGGVVNTNVGGGATIAVDGLCEGPGASAVLFAGVVDALDAGSGVVIGVGVGAGSGVVAVVGAVDSLGTLSGAVGNVGSVNGFGTGSGVI